jgi:putative nucleotidyltransferase with HDIG domain
VGGLIEHILELVSLCRDVAKHFPAVDPDLVTVGAFLHDIGKVRELAVRKTIEYTTPGRLIGHISLGYEMLIEKIAAIPGFPDETAMLLKHIMLSHHGEYEFAQKRLSPGSGGHQLPRRLGGEAQPSTPMKESVAEGLDELQQDVRPLSVPSSQRRAPEGPDPAETAKAGDGQAAAGAVTVLRFPGSYGMTQCSRVAGRSCENARLSERRSARALSGREG